MDLSPRSMASVWMVGLEDRPDRCGEICIFEVFGDAPTAVGSGVHRFRDPALTEEFSAPEMEIDVSAFHVYAADWQPGQLRRRRPCEDRRAGAAYPMQMMVGVFDFPDKARLAPRSTCRKPRWTTSACRWRRTPARRRRPHAR